MSETSSSEQPLKDSSPAVAMSERGAVSRWLSSQDLQHDVLEPDHIGIEQIGVEPAVLLVVATALKSHGFDYLQCQGGYDEGPGERPRDSGNLRPAIR